MTAMNRSTAVPAVDGATEAGAGRWLRGGLAAGLAFVATLAVTSWALLPPLAADPTTSGNVVPSDWVVPAVTLVVIVIAGLVLTRDPTHRYGWLLVATAVVMGTQVAAGAYALYAIYVVPDAGMPLASTAAWLQDAVAWPGMAIVVLLLPSLFPDGRVVPGRWGSALRATLGSWIGFTLVFNLTQRPLEGWFLDLAAAPENPLGVLPIPLLPLNVWWLLTMVTSVVVSLGCIVVRWRGAGRDLRQQMKWPLLAFVLVGVVVIADMVEVSLVHGLGVDVALGPLVEAGKAATMLLFAISMGLGVLRFRLYDVDRVINRTVVYAVLTAVVAAAYVVGVVGVSRMIPAANEQGLALGTTVVVAFAFDPVRRRLQAAANRWMFGQRDEPYAVLSRLGGAMAGAGAPAATLQTVVDTVATSLKLPWVAVELDQRGGHVVRAEHGRADDLAATAWSVPLVHREEEVGRLLAAPRSVREPLGPADRRLLEDIAHHAGAVAATARLTQDLQQSREELVLAREEERRRIRRDLHDGLGPSLAAQTLALDAAADRVGDDPGTARELLEGLKQETQHLVADIRRLVHELRPPALDELGLAGALVAHVAQVDGTGSLAVRVRTDPDPLPGLSAAVEVAAYRIAREAVTNVLRHADATRCDVRLAVTADALDVRVVDDGIGLPVVPGVGVGMRSMRERAEELGGTFRATDVAGSGTEVVATLPLIDAAAGRRGPRPAAGTGGGSRGLEGRGRSSAEVMRG